MTTQRDSEIRPARHRAPLFVTFYSYKGGVGRTLALLYSALVLAGRRRRVLMIDFDLEAPGLTLLANRALGHTGDRPGLVELITDATGADPTGSIADPSRPNSFHDKYVHALPIPKYAIVVPGGSIELMPCGALGQNYEERLYSIRFQDLYAMGVGKPFFQHFREVIRRSGLYDYVFIDSRTGFSDEGGICTRDLAEAIVLITGLNHQNVDGTIRFLERASEAGAPLHNLVVAFSPIPAGYEELRAPRETAILEALAALRPGAATHPVRIPYHPRLALDETPFEFDWKGAEIWRSYQDVALAIREFSSDTPSEMAQRVILRLGQGRHNEAVGDAVDLSIEDSRLFELILDSTAAPVQADAAARLIAEPFLAALSEALPHQLAVWTNLAAVRERAGDFEGSLVAHMHIVSTLSLDASMKADHHLAIGRLLALLGRYAEALGQHRVALEIATSLQDNPRVIACRRELGKLFLLSGRFQEATAELEEALRLAIDSEPPGGSRAELLRLVGDVCFAQAEFERAGQHYGAALELAIESGNDRGRCQSEWRIGRTRLEQGAFDQARLFIQSALELSEGVIDQAIRGECFLVRARLDLELGDLAVAQQDLTVARSLLPEGGESFVFDDLSLLDALLLDMRGQWAAAADSLFRLVSFFEERGRPIQVTSALLALGTSLRHSGRLHQAKIHYEAAMRRANRLRLFHKKALANSEIGYIDVLSGDAVQPGISAIQNARRRFITLGQEGFALTTAVRLADSHVRINDGHTALSILGSIWNDLINRVSPVAFNEARIVRARAGLLIGQTRGPLGQLKQAVEFARERGIQKPFFVEAAELLVEHPSA